MMLKINYEGLVTIDSLDRSVNKNFNIETTCLMSTITIFEGT